MEETNQENIHQQKCLILREMEKTLMKIEKLDDKKTLLKVRFLELKNDLVILEGNLK